MTGSTVSQPCTAKIKHSNIKCRMRHIPLLKSNGFFFYSFVHRPQTTPRGHYFIAIASFCHFIHSKFRKTIFQMILGRSVYIWTSLLLTSFNSFLASGYFCRLVITFANSWTQIRPNEMSGILRYL